MSRLHALTSMFTMIVGTDEMVNIEVGEITETGATVVCKLPCFSKDIGCIPSIWYRKGEKIEEYKDSTFYISNITGDPLSYSYPSQNITATNLSSGNTYILCVRAYNLTTTELQGLPVCENFTTIYHDDDDDDDDGKYVAKMCRWL